MKILSYGGGVNTGALLALAVKGEPEVDYIIFADTGGELPETYKWIEEIAKPAAEEIGTPFVTVHGKHRTYRTLYAYLWHYKVTPSRTVRSCTDKYKVQPIQKWILEHLTDTTPEMIIGIDAGEAHRAREGKVFHTRYPLIERGINRRECKRIIKRQGWEIPIKSGCFFCPFARVGQMKKLYENHPGTFMAAEYLEKNCYRYPEITILKGYRLEDLRKRVDSGTIQSTLRDGFDSSCLMCHL